MIINGRLKDVVAVAGGGAMVIFASRRQDAARHSPGGSKFHAYAPAFYCPRHNLK